jgi:hypothetical protein
MKYSFIWQSHFYWSKVSGRALQRRKRRSLLLAGITMDIPSVECPFYSTFFAQAGASLAMGLCCKTD